MKKKMIDQLVVKGKKYHFYSLQKLSDFYQKELTHLPFSLKILLENMLRNSTEENEGDLKVLTTWSPSSDSQKEITFYPARVVMQDFTGVPAVVDLAAMRDALLNMKGDPKKINPQIPVDLVIDHSVMVDYFGHEEALHKNMDLEFERNRERYQFLRWGQKAFSNFRVVPPGTGIIHQVNLEYLAKVVWTSKKEGSGEMWAYPDTVVGTDSHTTMINGLSVLGWGVGGIEAEAAMLGQGISMLIPEVVGFELKGQLLEGVTATDLVLTIVQQLRKKGVVGKFVEFYGEGLRELSLADRATIANMAPEYGATCGFFPIDQETLNYLRFTGRGDEEVLLVEKYAKAQGLWSDGRSQDFSFNDTLSLSLGDVVPCLAGPKRPQDRVILSDVAKSFEQELTNSFHVKDSNCQVKIDGMPGEVLSHGDVVIAAITSCTNTSNPSVLITAGLLAKKAVMKGLTVKPWVKTSLAPGSQVVTDYLERAGLQQYLDKLGFQTVGYGCTTCIGNSGPLPDAIAKAVQAKDLVACSVLSGNRNFEGRVNPHVKANYLASPPLVVAYALAGTMKKDLTSDAIGKDSDGKSVYLKDIWPTQKEIQNSLLESLQPSMFTNRYQNVFQGPLEWQSLPLVESEKYHWDNHSTYIQNPPYFTHFNGSKQTPKDIKKARALAILGDSVTTDHISPAGSIKESSPAGLYLKENGVSVSDFNSYGSRRGNHEVMMRGTFANIRIRNEMIPGVEGGFTKHIPSGKNLSIYDAGQTYRGERVPLIIIAGKEYGTGSSRDWAAKGTTLLGVRAVIAESFERIHRSNLVGMGVLPLEFQPGIDRKTLKLVGDEEFSLTGLGELTPGGTVKLTIKRKSGEVDIVTLQVRIDTEKEYDYFCYGGILNYVLADLVRS